MNQDPTSKRRAAHGALVALGAVAVVALLLYQAGFRIVRASGRPVPLAGSELERTTAATPWVPPAAASGDHPVNLVIFVADGLGFAHLSAARAALHGIGAPAVWDRFEAVGWHRSHPATGFLGDSASSATALATGQPTHYGRVGVDTEGTALPSLIERAAAAGYRTGIVTDSYVWDATPAAFTAHVTNRDDAAAILEQLAESPLEILAGELEDLGEGQVPERDATVEILARRFRIYDADAESAARFLAEAAAGPPAAALYDEDQIGDLSSTPNLPQLTRVALDRLSSDERPFVLLVESEEPDSASHRGDFPRLLRGLEAIEATLELILDRVQPAGDTLLLFTSDHETGGLALSIGDNTNRTLRALWPTADHTGTVVPVLATGPGSERFAGSWATWQIGRLLGELIATPEQEATAAAIE